MSKPTPKRIGDVLVDLGAATTEEKQRALAMQTERAGRLGEILVEQGICTDDDIVHALANQLGIEKIDVRRYPVDPAALDLVPEKVAARHLLMPLAVEGGNLLVAMADPLNLEAIQDLSFTSGLNIGRATSTRRDILWAIGHHYHISESMDSLIEDISSDQDVQVVQRSEDTWVGIGDLKRKSQEAPIIRMVNILISRAVEQGASDIHIEPAVSEVQVRNRVDGLLRSDNTLPKWVQGAVISRLKIMAGLDIAEKRLPQDGRIRVLVSGNTYDLRVSVLPTNHGEKVVIRILDPNRSISDIRALDLDATNLQKMLEMIAKPQGVILVTGPTGSGKTTTLYSALSHIKGEKTNITTIEDPVEYDLEGINQIPISEKVGLSFAGALRSILRQDPDIIMVGEMRDAETAEVAMQAALTGHLVFSTIHTRNSVATIGRLRHLGIPSYLIAGSVIGITAQRLARRLCPDCRSRHTPSEAGLGALGITRNAANSLTFYEAQGCSRCSGTGYLGRVGIHEILVFTRKVKELIVGEASEPTIKEAAVAEGMRTLAGDAAEKLTEGVTSLEEILRVVHSDEDLPTYCPSCSSSVALEYRVCPDCGTALHHTCPSCGGATKQTWQYCALCAAELAA